MLANQAVTVEDRFAAVNYYPTSFNACQPLHFCHLVFFQIKEGSSGLYGLLDTIFAQIGKVVCHFISAGTAFHTIIILMENTRHTFAPRIRIAYKASHSEEVMFDMIDKEPRCIPCFPQEHKTEKCSYIPSANFKDCSTQRLFDPCYQEPNFDVGGIGKLYKEAFEVGRE
jgi:hypothetical protein